MANSILEPFVRNAWYIAAWSDELGDELISRMIMNEPIVLFRDSDGKAAALEDRCCHRAAPLSHGKRIDRGLQCGYHGLVFNGAGECIEIPGQEKIPDQACVVSYPVVERQHFVWIWMGDPVAADENKIIDYPFFAQADKCPSRKGMMEIKANYMMGVDNLMDLTHVGYIHRSTIGGGDPKEHSNADMVVTPTETGVIMERWMYDIEPPPTFTRSVDFKGNVDRWQEFEYVAPSTVLQWSGAIDVGKNARENRNQEGFHFRNVHSATPKTESSYYYFFGIGHLHRLGEPQETEKLYQENVETFLEDRDIIEVQQLRLERSPDRPLIDIRTDVPVMRSHQALRRLIEAERNKTV